MNINDVKEWDLGIDASQDKLHLIFQRQLDLMRHYHPIEKANGLLITEDVPVNLQDSKGQYRIKDFAWRVTEELGEALEALYIHSTIREHFDEEIADALHFLVELTILTGVSPNELVPEGVNGAKLEVLFHVSYGKKDINPWPRSYPSIAMRTAEVVEKLAVACNCLKNKPWKQTQMFTDVDAFISYLRNTWRQFIVLCAVAGIGPDYLFELYFKKSQVNQFRVRSQY